MYKCLECGKWFEVAKLEKSVAKSYRTGKTEVTHRGLCPFCGARVYPRAGVMAAVVAFWLRLKEHFARR